MSALPPNIRERLDELLVAQTLGELSVAERAELDALLRNEAAAELARNTDAAAAALLLAFRDDAPVRMPADARARLLAKGRSMAAGSASASDPSTGRAVIGWLIAAALAIVAAIGWLRPLPQPPTPPRELTMQERFDALANAPGTTRVTLAPQANPRAQGVTAEVVWNNEKQEGYLIVNKLAANTPTVDQYQFWFFDGTQNYPVDGGVFDIPASATGPVIVPLDAKLKVGKPEKFAVTVEKPGGVVVTDAKGLLLLGAAQ